jgi:hypothetical protein
MAMINARIDITKDLEGHPVVLAVFDVTEAEIAGAAHAVSAIRAERYRNAQLGADDVLAMRELTALADELGALVSRGGAGTQVLRPARLTVMRDALDAFVTGRDEAEWMRDEDREPLATARALLWPLSDLCGDALRAALAAASPSAAP